jgi:hypothetical protein
LQASRQSSISTTFFFDLKARIGATIDFGNNQQDLGGSADFGRYSGCSGNPECSSRCSAFAFWRRGAAQTSWPRLYAPSSFGLEIYVGLKARTGVLLMAATGSFS